MYTGKPLLPVGSGTGVEFATGGALGTIRPADRLQRAVLQTRNERMVLMSIDKITYHGSTTAFWSKNAVC